MISRLLAAVAMALVSTAHAGAADPENTLILELEDGPVTIELLPEIAPGHVERIKKLTREGFYDGARASSKIPRKAFTMASSSTASSPASWRRPAIRPAPAWARPTIRT